MCKPICDTKNISHEHDFIFCVEDTLRNSGFHAKANEFSAIAPVILTEEHRRVYASNFVDLR